MAEEKNIKKINKMTKEELTSTINKLKGHESSKYFEALKNQVKVLEIKA
jgi:hypothetical protein